jgi:hypothetical protein
MTTRGSMNSLLRMASSPRRTSFRIWEFPLAVVAPDPPQPGFRLYEISPSLGRNHECVALELSLPLLYPEVADDVPRIIESVPEELQDLLFSVVDGFVEFT